MRDDGTGARSASSASRRAPPPACQRIVVGIQGGGVEPRRARRGRRGRRGPAASPPPPAASAAPGTPAPRHCSTACRQSVVLPMPGSPRMTSARSPSGTAATNASMRACSASRPDDQWPDQRPGRRHRPPLDYRNARCAVTGAARAGACVWPQNGRGSDGRGSRRRLCRRRTRVLTRAPRSPPGRDGSWARPGRAR